MCEISFSLSVVNFSSKKSAQSGIRRPWSMRRHHGGLQVLGALPPIEGDHRGENCLPICVGATMTSIIELGLGLSINSNPNPNMAECIVEPTHIDRHLSPSAVRLDQRDSSPNSEVEASESSMMPPPKGTYMFPRDSRPSYQKGDGPIASVFLFFYFFLITTRCVKFNSACKS